MLWNASGLEFRRVFFVSGFHEFLAAIHFRGLSPSEFSNPINRKWLRTADRQKLFMPPPGIDHFCHEYGPNDFSHMSMNVSMSSDIKSLENSRTR